MKFNILTAMSAGALLCAVPATAATITYDYANATTSTSLAASGVAAGFTASALTLTNAANTATSFDNHFYHNGWSTTFNLAKYYQNVINSASPFQMGVVSFSVESVTTAATSVQLAYSLDGFATAGTVVGTSTIPNDVVANFSYNLASLGTLTGPVTFRWYFTAPNTGTTVGFANHQCPGSGCGLTDVGGDLIFNVQVVPEPATWAMMIAGFGLIGGAMRRRATVRSVTFA